MKRRFFQVLCRRIRMPLTAAAAFALMTASLCLCAPLDQGRVEKIYFDGDLEKVLEVLENYRSTEKNPDSASAAFMYKYLGVVYSSIPETRDKGESFFYQLVKMDPEATLIDMYVSDTINEIFEKLKAEHKARLAYERKKKGLQADTAVTAAAEEDKTGEVISEPQDNFSHRKLCPGIFPGMRQIQVPGCCPRKKILFLPVITFNFIVSGGSIIMAAICLRK